MKKTILISFSLLFITGQFFAQQSDTTMLNLLNPTNPTEFIFTNNGYWDQTYNDTDYIFFKSQIFSFSHQIEGPGCAVYGWTGFTVCNSGDNTNYSGQWNDKQWGCMAGGGIKTDAQGNVMTDENGDVMVEKEIPYLVAYWYYMIEPEYESWGLWSIFLDEPTRCLQIHLDNDEEYEAVGVYVNNHPWAYYVNRDGDGYAHPLNQPGDCFKLIIHGYNPDGTESGKSVEHIFAKFENGQLNQSTKWEWVDLSSLGEIGGIYCTMTSTEENIVGPISPMYFCMDKLQVRTKEENPIIVPVTNITNLPDSALVGEPLTLTGTVVPENATNKTIIWSIESAGTTGATITGNTFIATGTGMAEVKATILNGIAEGENYTKTFNITVTKATQVAPPAPTLNNSTTTSITLNIIPDCEYRMDGGAWQSSAIFNELIPNTTYSFKAYKPETETHYASDQSPVAQFSTKPLGIDANEFNNVKIYSYSNSIFIKNESEIAIQSVEIIDITGRSVYQSIINNNETVITLSISSGFYFVKLTTEENTTSITKLWVE